MEERIALLRSLMAPDDQADLTDEQAAGLLGAAGDALLNRLYPFGWADEPVPPRYYTLQCRLALELWAKQGAEGQNYHAENGVTRTWENSTLSPLLRAVTPFVGGVAPVYVPPEEPEPPEEPTEPVEPVEPEEPENPGTPEEGSDAESETKRPTDLVL